MSFFNHILYLFTCFSGSEFGEFDANCALRGADTISNHIYDLASDCRLKLKDILQEPLESGAICVSPDLWSDNHKKTSYLGITATFTTSTHEYKSVDLCCKPFEGDDHSGKNILIVSIAFLSYKIVFSRSFYTVSRSIGKES